MYGKIVVTAAAAAAIVGSGTAALAATGDSGSSGTHKPAASDSSGSQHPRHPRLIDLARDAVRGQVVVKDKAGKYVTEQFARGTAIEATSQLIKVHSADGAATVFTVTAKTKVETCTPAESKSERRAPATKPARCTTISIDSVTSADRVVVLGTGATAPVADRVLVLEPKAPGGTAS